MVCPKTGGCKLKKIVSLFIWFLLVFVQLYGEDFVLVQKTPVDSEYLYYTPIKKLGPDYLESGFAYCCGIGGFSLFKDVMMIRINPTRDNFFSEKYCTRSIYMKKENNVWRKIEKPADLYELAKKYRSIDLTSPDIGPGSDGSDDFFVAFEYGKMRAISRDEFELSSEIMADPDFIPRDMSEIKGDNIKKSSATNKERIYLNEQTLKSSWFFFMGCDVDGLLYYKGQYDIRDSNRTAVYDTEFMVTNPKNGKTLYIYIPREKLFTQFFFNNEDNYFVNKTDSYAVDFTTGDIYRWNISEDLVNWELSVMKNSWKEKLLD